LLYARRGADGDDAAPAALAQNLGRRNFQRETEHMRLCRNQRLYLSVIIVREPFRQRRRTYPELAVKRHKPKPQAIDLLLAELGFRISRDHRLMANGLFVSNRISPAIFVI